MLKDVAPAAASASCKTPIERVKEIGTKLKINGTPTIFLADGQRIPGMVRAAQLEEMFKELAAKK
jgi:thiol:disulfide interchange protein DsbC